MREAAIQFARKTTAKRKDIAADDLAGIRAAARCGPSIIELAVQLR